MPDHPFHVRATDGEGNVSDRHVTAESVAALVERLRGEGLQASEVRGPRARRLFEPRSFSAEDFAAFNAELAAACRANVPLPGALRAFSRDLSGRDARDALEEVAEQIEDGTDFSSALTARPDVFPAAYIALVAAGLKAGDLAGTLLLFAEESRFTARVRHKLLGAIAYPVVILLAGSLLLSLGGWVILPAFEEMFAAFAEIGIGLPVLSRLFLNLAPIFRWLPLAVVAALIILPSVWAALLRAAVVARHAGALALKLPLAGRLFHALAMARFCRTLSMALAGNVPMPESIALAGLASGNAAVQAAAERVRASVAEGGTLADGLEDARGIFPATLVWMLSLGEKRGEIRPALDEYAKLLDERTHRLGESVPILAAALVMAPGAVLVLFGMLAVFLPLIHLMESFG